MVLYDQCYQKQKELKTACAEMELRYAVVCRLVEKMMDDPKWAPHVPEGTWPFMSILCSEYSEECMGDYSKLNRATENLTIATGNYVDVDEELIEIEDKIIERLSLYQLTRSPYPSSSELTAQFQEEVKKGFKDSRVFRRKMVEDFKPEQDGTWEKMKQDAFDTNMVFFSQKCAERVEELKLEPPMTPPPSIPEERITSGFSQRRSPEESAASQVLQAALETVR